MNKQDRKDLCVALTAAQESGIVQLLIEICLPNADDEKVYFVFVIMEFLNFVISFCVKYLSHLGSMVSVSTPLPSHLSLSLSLSLPPLPTVSVIAGSTSLSIEGDSVSHMFLPTSGTCVYIHVYMCTSRGIHVHVLCCFALLFV